MWTLPDPLYPLKISPPFFLVLLLLFLKVFTPMYTVVHTVMLTRSTEEAVLGLTTMVDKIWNDRKGYLLRSHLISQPTSVDYSCIYKPYPKVANCAVHLWLWVSSRLKGVWSWGGVPVTRDVTCPSAPPFFACSLLLAHEFVNLSPPHVGSWAVHESTVLWTGWRLVFLSQVTIPTLVGWGEVRREADLEEAEKNERCIVQVFGVRELRRGIH